MLQMKALKLNVMIRRLIIHQIDTFLIHGRILESKVYFEKRR